MYVFIKFTIKIPLLLNYKLCQILLFHSKNKETKKQLQKQNHALQKNRSNLPVTLKKVK